MIMIMVMTVRMIFQKRMTIVTVVMMRDADVGEDMVMTTTNDGNSDNVTVLTTVTQDKWDM